MKVFSSLTNRIFFASALLAVLAIGVAVYRVNVAVTAQAENELRRGIEEAGTLLEEYRTTLFGHFSREAMLVADLPDLKAAMTTLDAPTVAADRRPTTRDASTRTCSSSPIRRAVSWPKPDGSGCGATASRRRTRSGGRPSDRDGVAVAAPGGVIQVVSGPELDHAATSCSGR